MRAVWMLVVVGTWVAAGLVEPRASTDTVVLPAPPSMKVKGVALDGQGALLPMAELRSLLGTQAGIALDADQLDLDREAIAQTLVARGYLAASTTASVTPSREGVYVVFDVAPGPLYRVRSVAVTGPAQQLEASLQAAIGEDASDERITRMRRAVADSLARRPGKVTIEVSLVADPATASVDLELASRIVTLGR